MRGKAAILFLLAMLAGCASDDPRLYTLRSYPGQVLSSFHHVVLILPPAVPHYLERSEIVRDTGETTRKAEDDDRWDEPLRQMLPRVLAADLSQRLPQSDFLTEDDGAAAGAEARVKVDVQRFDDLGGTVVLTGHIGVQSGSQSWRFEPLNVTAPVSQPGTAGQVEAMSAALGQVADIAAGRLSAIAAVPVIRGVQAGAGTS